MNLCLILSILMALPQLRIATPPDAPVAVIGSGVVILDGRIDEAGRFTDIRVLHGSAPFVQPSIEALRAWSFTVDEQTAPDRVSVTFLYRSRSVFASPPVQLRTAETCCKNGDRPAIPIRIMDALYPANSIAQDAVILQLDIGRRGEIRDVRVARAVASLTDAAVAAVRRWEFTNAVTRNRGIASTSIVVISFLRPVLSQR